jgi:hypothetical protein
MFDDYDLEARRRGGGRGGGRSGGGEALLPTHSEKMSMFNFNPAEHIVGGVRGIMGGSGEKDSKRRNAHQELAEALRRGDIARASEIQRELEALDMEAANRSASSINNYRADGEFNRAINNLMDPLNPYNPDGFLTRSEDARARRNAIFSDSMMNRAAERVTDRDMRKESQRNIAMAGRDMLNRRQSVGSALSDMANAYAQLR